MSKKEALIADAGLYSSMAILTQLVTLLVGILTRRFLGPVQMGIWSVLQIILIYSSYSPLGTTEAISREIPFYRAKGESERAEEIKNLIFSFSLLTAGLISIGVVGYALLFKAALSEEIYHGLLFISALVLLQRTSNLNIAFLRGYKLFGLAARQMFISAIVNGVLVAVLTMKFRMFGFMWAMCFSFAFNIFYIYAHHRFGFRWRMDAKKIWGLIQYGFPLLIVSLLSVLFLTIDKIMIAKMLGFRELGLYSVAILAYTYIGNVPNSIGIVLIPNFHEKFGENERPEDLRGYLVKSSLVFSELMPILIAAAWFLIPYFARIVLPDFLGSVEPMRALILSSFFLALLHPYSYFLAVIRKQMLLVPIVGTACVLAVAFNYFAIRAGWGIVGVGIATTAVLFIKFTATYFIACRRLFSAAEAGRNYAVFLAKFALMAGVLFTLGRAFAAADRSLGLTSAALGIFGIVYLPFIVKLNRDLGIFAALRSKFTRRALPESVTEA